ncbi:MAG: hypothetical protein A3I05_03560 [Deltaproteobacteria bacterium RIFCSPLOWO2_02_FULL_44_10]|nr:MAG: hypothetical protein A3C46_03135 [Deltaproteobacteria bacterium RIFCSPHIGHO2_02_FULL_44_16]OGQ46248.1 MAG: hypothetical protein A3I05_03560 [Deltaproteobacteria bacterium RIFCSPLOWO2_02_FULL_44_10]
MWRLFKFIFFSGLLILAALTILGHEIGGKTIPEHVRSFLSRDGMKENVKDIRVLVGEAIKAVGSEIEGEVTEAEQKAMEKLVKEALEETPPPEKNNKN